MTDPAARAAGAIDIFGKAGVGLLPLLASGSDGLKALGDEAVLAGATFDDIDVKNVQAANDALLRVGRIVGDVGKQIAIFFAPLVRYVATEFANWANAGDGIKGKVGTALDYLVGGLGRMMDASNFIMAGVHNFRAAALQAIAAILSGIDKLGKKAVELINLLPGGKNVKWTDGIKNLVHGLEVEAASEVDKASKAFRAFKDRKATADLRFLLEALKLAGAPESVPPPPAGEEGGPGQQRVEQLQKINEMIEKLTTANHEWGMSEAAKTTQQLLALGATAEQIAQAQALTDTVNALNDVQNIGGGNALDTYAAKMERLNDLLQAGTISAAQFGSASGAAMNDRNKALDGLAASIIESIKTPEERYAETVDQLQSLFDTGRLTAEQMQLAHEQARGPTGTTEQEEEAPKRGASSGIIGAGSREAANLIATNLNQRNASRDISKDQLRVATQHTAILERIARASESNVLEMYA